MKKYILFLSMAVLITTGFSFFEDWRQYLGPNRNGVSAEKGIKRSWPQSGPEVFWTFPLGKGYGGPVINKGKVYVLDRISEKKDILRCINFTSGKEEWTFSYDAPGKLSYPGSRAVPAVEGNYIYLCGPFGDIHCLNINTHKVVWKSKLWTNFEEEDIAAFGVSQHPLIFENLLILASQTQKAGVVAFDKLTGEVKWKSSPLPGDPAFVTPKIITIDKTPQLIMISGSIKSKGAVLAMNPRTGKELWSYDKWQCRTPVPNVTECKDGKIFITSGYRAGSAMIQVKKQGNKFKVTELFRTKEFGTHVHPPLYYKGHLYGPCSTNETRDGLVCINMEGKIMWKTGRKPLFNKGGLILVDGLIVSMDGEKGFLYLIKPDPKGFKPLAKAKLLDTRFCWAPLALTDGKLLIRDQKQMKCVNLR